MKLDYPEQVAKLLFRIAIIGEFRNMALTNTHSNKKTILVIDDDKNAVNLVSYILRSNGYEVEQAEGGEEGKRKLKSMKPDVIMLDLNMPTLNGYDLAKWIKSNPNLYEVPLIMLTAKGKANDIMDGYSKYGADYYIPKPFNSAHLVDGVNLMFEKLDCCS